MHIEHSIMDWVALGLVIFGLFLVITVFLIAHEIPYKVAKQRDHPHIDAIHAACWISVFTGGLIWPLTLIWSYMGRPQVSIHTVPTEQSAEELNNAALDEVDRT